MVAGAGPSLAAVAAASSGEAVRWRRSSIWPRREWPSASARLGEAAEPTGPRRGWLRRTCARRDGSIRSSRIAMRPRRRLASEAVDALPRRWRGGAAASACDALCVGHGSWCQRPRPTRLYGARHLYTGRARGGGIPARQVAAQQRSASLCSGRRRRDFRRAAAPLDRAHGGDRGAADIGASSTQSGARHRELAP